MNRYLLASLTAVSMISLSQAERSSSQSDTNLSRSLSLMAESTPEHRNTVRVLFYGQSITEQDWWKKVAEDLRKTFPDADLQIENRAIAGHAAQILVKTSEADLYPFYPDLLIFHVYGDHTKYEDIIRRVRERTTADVLIQSDHLGRKDKIDEETDPTKLTPAEWSPWFNYVFLPGIASKYRVNVIDQRDAWKACLREKNLEPGDLLRDGVHLNDHGNEVMASIVSSHLRPPLSAGAPDDRVTTIPVGAGDWKGGRLSVEFTGNRVDAILGADGESTPVRVEIDGKSPGQFQSAYRVTKTTGYLGTNWPCLLQVRRGPTPWVPEKWTVTVSDANNDYSQFRFHVEGSVSGPDGEGIATETFVSKSGKLVIAPDDWNLTFCRKVFGKPLPEGSKITFEVVPMFVDSFVAEPATDPTTESVVTLAQGLPNTAHQLTLLAEGVPPISALRVYKPPFPSTEDPAKDASDGRRYAEPPDLAKAEVVASEVSVGDENENPANLPVLSQVDQPFLFSHGSWENKVNVEDSVATLRCADSKGGAGVNESMAVPADHLPALRVKVGEGNKARTLKLALLDSDRASGTWNFDLSKITPGVPTTITPVGGHSFSDPPATGKPGVRPDSSKLMQWQLLGDWSGDPIDVEVSLILAVPR